MTKKYHINDEFEIKGHWSLPDTNKRISGILKYNTEGIVLELFGAFDRTESFDLDKKGYGFVHGICEKNLLVTLYDGFEISYSMGVIVTSKLIFNKIFMGAHFSSEDELKFHSLSVKYTYLEKWFDDRVFSHEYQLGAGGRGVKEINLSYVPPNNLFKVEIDSANAVIEGSYILDTNIDSATGKLSHENLINYVHSTEEFKEVEWFEALMFKMNNFLSFMMNRKINERQIIAKGKLDDKKQVRERIYIFPSKAFSEIEKKIHPSELFVSLPDVSNIISEVINNWFNNSIEPSIQNYMRSMYYGGSDTVINFLNYTKALESYHRNSEGGQYLTDRQFSEIRSKMFEAINDLTSEEIKAKLRGALAYAHHYEFEKRIVQCLSNIETKTRDLIIDENKIEYFSTRIKKTRNYHTHYGKKQNGVIEEGFDLYFTNQILKTVLFYWIARTINIPEELLLTKIDEDYNLKRRLDNASYLYVEEE
ncbi:hypothetical protein P4V43_25550 [Brevibacillus fortis]|uniref:ApeA N-terminal domain 1-containing protein n=1 Tax=Brevibacillus fortis TaxID=2126352 RepID=UPI002E243188|nr:hypothetical protein [Brevibacillus fortis]